MGFFKRYKKQILAVLFPISIFGGGYCYGGIVLLMDVQKGLLVADIKSYEESERLRFEKINKGEER
jgi:hypothetical protein